MRTGLLVAVLVLGACSGGKAGSDDANATTAAAAASAPAAGAASVACDIKPDFVPVRTGATITLCTKGAGVGANRESGSILYTTDADAKTVKAWSLAQAQASGLAKALDSDSPSAMFSARGSGNRTLMVIAEAEGTGSKVTVNWGRTL